MSLIILIVVGVIVILLIACAIKMYNSLIVLKNRVENQGAQIEVQLKRRADLIPNLIETTKGYAKYEKGTLMAVTELRSKVLNAASTEESYQANAELNKEVSRIMAVSENYPELKANTNFQALQQELTETESKIASARQFYNDTVMVYNNKVAMVPSNIIASLFRFEKEAFFEANETERQNVQVKF